MVRPFHIAIVLIAISVSGAACPDPVNENLPPLPISQTETLAKDPSSVAMDGDPETVWNAGASAPQALTLDLGGAETISRIRLNVAQTPSGPTVHEIYGGLTPCNLRLLGRLEGDTVDGQWLELKLASAARGIRHLKILTTASPSWVAWREIEAYSVSSGVKYFGYYAGGGFIDETQDHSNIAWIWGAGLNVDYTVTLLDSACTKGMQAVVDIFHVFYDNETFLLKPGYEERWQEFADIIGPRIGSIAAIYGFDEPFWNGRLKGVPADTIKRDMETVSALVKKTFPRTPMGVIHAAYVSDFIPLEGYDWVGFDCYGGWDNCNGQSIPSYVAALKATMRPSDKLMIISDAFMPKLNPTDEDKLGLIKRTFQYMQTYIPDPSIIGIFPFIYQSMQDDAGNYISTGVKDMPLVREKHVKIGHHISSK